MLWQGIQPQWFCIIKHFLQQARSSFTVMSLERTSPPCHHSYAGRAEWEEQGRTPCFHQHTRAMHGIDNPFHSKKGITYCTHLSCTAIWNNPFHWFIKCFSRISFIILTCNPSLSFFLTLLGTGMLGNWSKLSGWNILMLGSRREKQFSTHSTASLSSNQCY